LSKWELENEKKLANKEKDVAAPRMSKKRRMKVEKIERDASLSEG
jgi:hypothetical protein